MSICVDLNSDLANFFVVLICLLLGEKMEHWNHLTLDEFLSKGN